MSEARPLQDELASRNGEVEVESLDDTRTRARDDTLGTRTHPLRDRNPGPGPSPGPSPGPGVVSQQRPGVVSVVSSPEPTELELMLDAHARGALVPVEVELGPLPPRAGETMHAIAEHMRLLMGLRLAFGETRPLPYATSVPVEAGIVATKGEASRVIRQLVRHGVVRHAGSLPPMRPGLNGTKVYEPPKGAKG
jgi:hypothetical protein